MRKWIIEKKFCDVIIKAVCLTKLNDAYNYDIPEALKKRVDEEITLINNNNFAIYYYIAQRIATKCRKESIPFGLRGTVGSSYVAFLLKITEINPLSKNNGGFDPPYEMLIAPDGSKKPDFSFIVPEECKDIIIEFLDEIIEEYHVSGAYYKDGEETCLHPTKVLFISDDPNDYASFLNLNGKEMKPEEYDFHDLLDYFVDIDICTNENYSKLKKLSDATGVYPDLSVIEDQGVLGLFKARDLDGIPEFNNEQVLKIMEDTGADGFDDYVRINLLYHGTKVWEANGEEMIKSGDIALKDLISSRDDVFTYLMSKGIERNMAYDISEYVRKGKAVSDKWNKWDEYSGIMKNADIPDWYIDSCKKIEYLFPRAHSTQNVILAMRMAYYKVYYPDAFIKVVSQECIK